MALRGIQFQLSSAVGAIAAIQSPTGSYTFVRTFPGGVAKSLNDLVPSGSRTITAKLWGAGGAGGDGVSNGGGGGGAAFAAHSFTYDKNSSVEHFLYVGNYGKSAALGNVPDGEATVITSGPTNVIAKAAGGKGGTDNVTAGAGGAVVDCVGNIVKRAGGNGANGDGAGTGGGGGSGATITDDGANAVLSNGGVAPNGGWSGGDGGAAAPPPFSENGEGTPVATTGINSGGSGGGGGGNGGTGGFGTFGMMIVSY